MDLLSFVRIDIQVERTLFVNVKDLNLTHRDQVGVAIVIVVIIAFSIVHPIFIFAVLIYFGELLLTVLVFVVFVLTIFYNIIHAA